MKTKRKIWSLSFAVILLIGMCFYFSNQLMSEKEVLAVNNELYDEYLMNKENFTVVGAEITGFLDPKSEEGLSWGKTPERFVKLKFSLKNGTEAETFIIEDKDDKPGDTIQIAYLNSSTDDLRYVSATRLYRVEYSKELIKINIFIIADILVMAVVVLFLVKTIIKQ